MPRILRVPGLPFGGGLNLVLAAGAAYFVWEHGGRTHGRLLCPLCWLNEVNPDSGASGEPRPGRPAAAGLTGGHDTAAARSFLACQSSHSDPADAG